VVAIGAPVVAIEMDDSLFHPLAVLGNTVNIDDSRRRVIMTMRNR